MSPLDPGVARRHARLVGGRPFLCYRVAPDLGPSRDPDEGGKCSAPLHREVIGRVTGMPGDARALVGFPELSFPFALFAPSPPEMTVVMRVPRASVK